MQNDPTQESPHGQGNWEQWYLFTWLSARKIYPLPSSRTWCRRRIADSLWFILAHICPSIRHSSISWTALCSALWNAENAVECSVSNASWETEAGARSTSMVQAVSRINSQRLEESPPWGSRIKIKDWAWHGKKKEQSRLSKDITHGQTGAAWLPLWYPALAGSFLL